MNTFLYPELDPAQIIGGFSDSLRSLCVAVYGIDPGLGNDAIERMFREIAPIDGIIVVRTAQGKIALVHFFNRDGVAAAFQSGASFRMELLSAHIMIRASELIQPQPRLVLAIGIGSAVSSAHLREVFGRVGAVKSAMVVYNAANGSSADRGLVLFESERDAVYACTNPPSDSAFRTSLTVVPFRPRGDIHRAPAPAAPPPAAGAAMPPPPPPMPFAGVPLPPRRPRQVLRDYARVTVPPDVFLPVFEAIDRLSLDDVYELVMDKARFDRWLYEFRAQF